MEQNQAHAHTDVKQKIINVATVLFADNGFEGTSVREIAKAAGVNLAMVSYYFGNKEGLYLECISNFAKDKVELISQLLGSPENVEEFKFRFRMFIENKLKAYAEDLNHHKIIMREIQTNRDHEIHAKVMSHLLPVFRTVEKFFQTGIDKKILKPGLNAEHLAIMMMGIVSHPCISEKSMKAHLGYTMAEDCARQAYCDQVCELFFAGVLL